MEENSLEKFKNRYAKYMGKNFDAKSITDENYQAMLTKGYFENNKQFICVDCMSNMRSTIEILTRYKACPICFTRFS